MNTNFGTARVSQETKHISELSQRALALHNEKLRAIVEPPQEGKGIAIHPDSGEYVVADTPTHASRAMRLRYPAGSFITMKIGPSPDYALAARLIAGRMASGQEQ